MSYSFRKFEPFTDVLKPFDCGNADLNGFLLDDARFYYKELIANTFVMEAKWF